MKLVNNKKKDNKTINYILGPKSIFSVKVYFNLIDKLHYGICLENYP